MPLQFAVAEAADRPPLPVPQVGDDADLRHHRGGPIGADDALQGAAADAAFLKITVTVRRWREAPRPNAFAARPEARRSGGDRRSPQDRRAEGCKTTLAGATAAARVVEPRPFPDSGLAGRKRPRR